MKETWLFVWLPYLAAASLPLGAARRLFFDGAAGGDGPAPIHRRFWRIPAWRIGISGILLAHLAGFLLPARLLAWNQRPERLLALEITLLALACLAVLGLLQGLWKLRGEARPVSVADAVGLTLLAIVLLSGVLVALLYRWGSSWYAATLVPYLISLLRLDPEPGLVTGLPWLVHLHVVGSFCLVAVIPWTGLTAGWAPRRARRWWRRTSAPTGR